MLTNEERQRACDEVNSKMQQFIAELLPSSKPTDGSSFVAAVRVTIVLQHRDNTQSATNLTGGVSSDAVEALDPNGVVDADLCNSDDRREYTLPARGRKH